MASRKPQLLVVSCDLCKSVALPWKLHNFERKKIEMIQKGFSMRGGKWINCYHLICLCGSFYLALMDKNT
ncbi:hypothetical protein H5410_027186 [Solanum commersonii]|uniref:Uncharacterized protein n=1 Tax=Solanum commersonii TaxID=4109 RepID=A0A9J5Z3P9_SOLCO|nr:hypothetical protein H5410_027186 [Solanum commersonii]